MSSNDIYTIFVGAERIASGKVGEVELAARECLAKGDRRTILAFNDVTGAQVELDLLEAPVTADGPLSRGGSAGRVAADGPRPKRFPGRPKLGVVGREITLLPRHWEWLNAQPGGASVALRKLVERARRDNESKDRVRRSQEAAFRFMSAIAGNEPGFEEASRSLFAGDSVAFSEHTRPWPPDIRSYAGTLAAGAFEDQG